jgi:xanthine/CO dehydrogenase XdhC/CoxF family maturation factor
VDAPEEIALATIAEIKTTLANRAGGFLRERNKPIHNS